MIPEISVKIKDKNYKIVLNNGAKNLYEEITNKSFYKITGKNSEFSTLFLACLFYNNDGFDIDYKEFLEILDENYEIYDEFLKYYTQIIQFELSRIKDNKEDKKEDKEEKKN